MDRPPRGWRDRRGQDRDARAGAPPGACSRRHPAARHHGACRATPPEAPGLVRQSEVRGATRLRRHRYRVPASLGRRRGMAPHGRAGLPEDHPGASRARAASQPTRRRPERRQGEGAATAHPASRAPGARRPVRALRGRPSFRPAKGDSPTKCSSASARSTDACESVSAILTDRSSSLRPIPTAPSPSRSPSAGEERT